MRAVRTGVTVFALHADQPRAVVAETGCDVSRVRPA